MIGEAHEPLLGGRARARRAGGRVRRAEHHRTVLPPDPRSRRRCCARWTRRPASRSSTSSRTPRAQKGTGAGPCRRP
ncbi:hypothetical protein QJS66_05350 [Kocuria rhizophila]|nr:hypothetical protein QJS66_05350 [Kocuria rhizophila]